MDSSTNRPNILENTKSSLIDGRWLPKIGEKYEKMITLLLNNAEYLPNNTAPHWLYAVEKHSAYGHTIVRYKWNTIASMWTSIFLKDEQKERSDWLWNTRFGAAAIVSENIIAIEDGPSAKQSKTGLVDIHTKQYCEDIDGLRICKRDLLGTGDKQLFPSWNDAPCIVYATTYDRNCKRQLVDTIVGNVVHPFSYEGKTAFDFIQRDHLGNVIIKDENRHLIIDKDGVCIYDNQDNPIKLSKHRNYECTNSFGHFAFDNGWVLIPGIMLYNKETVQHNTVLWNIVMQNNDHSQKQVYLLDENTYRTDPDGDTLFDDIHITKDYITMVKWNSGKILLTKNSNWAIVRKTNPLSTNQIKAIDPGYSLGRLIGFRIYNYDNEKYLYLPGEEWEWFHTKYRKDGPSVQPIRYSGYCIIKNQDGKYKLSDKNLDEYEVRVSNQAIWLLWQIFDDVQVHEKMSEFHGINTLSFEVKTEDWKRVLHAYSKNCWPHT